MNSLFLTFALFFGSIPWGYLIGKLKGIDLRKSGSGNIGATNVLRVIGKKEALLTLLLDISKGFIPVILVRYYYPPEQTLVFMGLAGILAILGHCFTPFLRFKGGKGVSTSIGVILAYTPLAGIITVIIWIVIFIIFRISSLSALIAFSLLPLNLFLFNYPDKSIMFTLCIVVIIYIRHLSNIKRLFKGTEPKIGDKK